MPAEHELEGVAVPLGGIGQGQHGAEPLLPAAASRPGATTPVRIADVIVGGPRLPVLAGPCAVEPPYVEHAMLVAGSGAAVLRGSVFKPRTRPNSFQGLGEAGFGLLDEARRLTGLPILSEPLSVLDVEVLMPHSDAFLIGTRSMQNTPLLRAVGRSRRPVVLKRAFSATYDEWLGAADYILGEGNDQVILCERGIRTFEPSTRNTLDVSAIVVLRERTPLPIIVDPSHASGRGEWVTALSMAALAAGADGLLVEAHPQPLNSWSDPGQAVTPAQLKRLIDAVELITAAVRPVPPTAEECARAVTCIDAAVERLSARRMLLHDLAQQRGDWTPAPAAAQRTARVGTP